MQTQFTQLPEARYVANRSLKLISDGPYTNRGVGLLLHRPHRRTGLELVVYVLG